MAMLTNMVVTWCVLGLACSLQVMEVSGQSVTITLHVFSGRPDPVWRLKNTEEAYQDVMSAVQGRDSTPLVSKLGYSGISVQTDSNTEPITLGACSDAATEMALLNLVKDRTPEGEEEPLSDNIIDMITHAVQAC